MVETITYLKQAWYKNTNDEGGAQNVAIENMLPNDICVLSHTQKNGRRWTSLSPEKLLNMLSKNYGLYEIITGYPHKLYFDVDWDLPEECSTPLLTIKDIILQFFPNAIMAVSGSETKERISYHVVVQNYTIGSIEEREKVKTIVKSMSEIHPAFDYKVYTNNRNMKCINQSKQDGRIQSIMENEDYKAHLITCFIPEFSEPIVNTIPSQFVEQFEINKSLQPFDITSLPKLKLEYTLDKSYVDLTVQEIFGLLPINQSCDHAYTHLVARFCWNNSISLDLFLDWIKKKHDERGNNWTDQRAKWVSHWERLARFPPVTHSKIKPILYAFYPSLKKDRSFNRFEQTFELDTDIRLIDRLSPTEFTGSEKYTIFNIGMGGGKTAQTIDHLKMTNNFCWICPNRALAHNTYNRLEDAGISITHYLSATKKQKQQGDLNRVNNLLIVINSLHYVDTRRFDEIIIDEVETVIDKWFGDFMQLKKQNWSVFKRIICGSNRVILLDAFVTKKTLGLIRHLDPTGTLQVYARINEPVTRSVTYLTGIQYTLSKIVQDLKDGLKLFIFYPFKDDSRMIEEAKAMSFIHKVLQNETGKPGVYYNADIDEKVKLGLRNVNKAWEDKSFVITNTVITCGVNYDLLGFDKTYLFIANFNGPRDIAQVSYRVRELSTNQINVCYIGNMTQSSGYAVDTHEINCTVYSKMIDSILIEKNAPIRESISLFFSKAHYTQCKDTSTITKELDTEMNELFKKEYTASWMGILDIDQNWADVIQNDIFRYKATIGDKLALQKFYFVKPFCGKPGLSNISTSICRTGEPLSTIVDKLQEAWNEQYALFFRQIRKHIHLGEDSIFQQIKHHNDLDEIFSFQDIKKIKLTPQIKTSIFKQFKFKYVHSTSPSITILKEIYNLFFKTKIINPIYQKGKHVSYAVKPNMSEWVEFVYRYSMNTDCNDTDLDPKACINEEQEEDD